ncbi:hypothetical protein ACB092_12G145300 [Castanea dentata]
MKNLTDSFLSLGLWSSAGSFGFNTNILATNPINLSVVLGLLIFFGKGVYNRKQRILKTIRNSEELRRGAIEQLEKARARLRKVEMEADQFQVNGYSDIEREKSNLINSTYRTLEQFKIYKNETIRFEQQRATLKGALGTLTSSLNNELHLRTINANIGMFGTLTEIID